MRASLSTAGNEAGRKTVIVFLLVALTVILTTFGLSFFALPRPSTSSAPYLSLGVSLNATSIRTGQNLTAFMWVNNTASFKNNVTAELDYPLNMSPVDPCGRFYPIYWGILPGLHVAGNAFDGVWLKPYVTAHSCNAYASSALKWIQFNPLSSTGEIARDWFGTDVSSGAVQEYLTIPGGMYPQIQPGTYTLVVGDEWGQVAVAWFSVRA